LLGAVIAAVIGIAGQLVMIASNESIEWDRRQEANKERIIGLLHRAIIICNVFINLKEVCESTDPDRNLIIGRFYITKPVFGTEFVERFSEKDIIVALLIRDPLLHTRISELDGMVANYQRFLPIYTRKFNELSDPTRLGIKFDAESETYQGSVEVRKSDLVEINDMHHNLISTVYHGLSHSIYVIEAIEKHLCDDFQFTLRFAHTLPEEELAHIREGLDS